MKSKQTPAPNSSAEAQVHEIWQLVAPAAFVRCQWGTKKPIAKRWGDGTVAETDSDMRNPAAVAKLAKGNIGIVQGGPSDGLISVDVDNDSDFEEFIALNLPIADTLRTRGARGGNIWYRMLGDYPPLSTLKRHGKPWGEWRSTGGQTMIYGQHPSRCHYQITKRCHPLKVRLDQFRWPDGVTPPQLDAECIQGHKDTKPQGHKDTNSHTVSVCKEWLVVSTVEEAVSLATPQSKHVNHKLLYKLAGALWAFEETTDATLSAGQLRAAFKLWHQRAKANGSLRPDQSEDEYLLEFLDAWQNVDHPLRADDIAIAWERAKAAPVPPEAIEAGLSNANVCLLVALCRELQNLRGKKPFYLSPYSVMRVFGQNTHTTAAKWLGGLKALNILTLIETGDFATRRAAAYRFNYKQP